MFGSELLTFCKTLQNAIFSVDSFFRGVFDWKHSFRRVLLCGLGSLNPNLAKMPSSD
jgi:hypothetical protein